MQTIYLVKKDPGRNGEDNWLILDRSAYEAFLRSGEGKKHIGRMEILPSEGEGCPRICVECGEGMRRKLLADRRRRSYTERMRRQAGITLVPIPETEEWEKDALLFRDFMPGPEEILLSRAETERLHRALARLNAEEREMVELLYLRRTPLLVSQYAGRKRISAALASYRKEGVLEKLRRWMEE